VPRRARSPWTSSTAFGPARSVVPAATSTAKPRGRESTPSKRATPGPIRIRRASRSATKPAGSGGIMGSTGGGGTTRSPARAPSAAGAGRAAGVAVGGHDARHARGLDAGREGDGEHGLAVAVAPVDHDGLAQALLAHALRRPHLERLEPLGAAVGGGEQELAP